MGALAGLVASLGGKLLGGIFGGIKSLFNFKEKKLDLSIFKETTNAKLQIAWWDYLKSAQSSVVNQVIRPATMALVLGDLFYQLWFTGGYKIIVIVPAMTLGGYTFGPITNGVMVCFVLFFLFPLRSIEKILMRKD